MNELKFENQIKIIMIPVNKSMWCFLSLLLIMWPNWGEFNRNQEEKKSSTPKTNFYTFSLFRLF